MLTYLRSLINQHDSKDNLFRYCLLRLVKSLCTNKHRTFIMPIRKHNLKANISKNTPHYNSRELRQQDFYKIESLFL